VSTLDAYKVKTRFQSLLFQIKLVPLRIGQAYTEDPNNPAYRFRHYFHNVVQPQHRVRPPGVDELTWRSLLDEVGGEHNAEGLWPVPGDGFKTLAERARVQDAEIRSEQEYLDAVQARVREMNRFRGGAVYKLHSNPVDL
jgi:hypothetical protein